MNWLNFSLNIGTRLIAYIWSVFYTQVIVPWNTCTEWNGIAYFSCSGLLPSSETSTYVGSQTYISLQFWLTQNLGQSQTNDFAPISHIPVLAIQKTKLYSRTPAVVSVITAPQTGWLEASNVYQAISCIVCTYNFLSFFFFRFSLQKPRSE